MLYNVFGYIYRGDANTLFQYRKLIYSGLYRHNRKTVFFLGEYLIINLYYSEHFILIPGRYTYTLFNEREYQSRVYI